MHTVANASLTLIPITIVYIILAWTGGPVLEDRKQLVGKNIFLALACAGHLVLYIMVWFNGYSKFSSTTLGV